MLIHYLFFLFCLLIFLVFLSFLFFPLEEPPLELFLCLEFLLSEVLLPFLFEYALFE